MEEGLRGKTAWCNAGQILPKFHHDSVRTITYFRLAKQSTTPFPRNFCDTNYVPAPGGVRIKNSGKFLSCFLNKIALLRLCECVGV